MRNVCSQSLQPSTCNQMKFQLSLTPGRAGSYRKETLSVFISVSILPAGSTEPRATISVCRMGSNSEEKAEDNSTILKRKPNAPHARIGSFQKETSGPTSGKRCC